MTTKYDAYLAHLRFKNCAPLTLKDYTKTLERFFREYADLTTENVLAFLSGDHKPSTKQKMRAHLCGYAKYERSPIDFERDVPPIKVPLDAPVVYTAEQIDLVYDYIQGARMQFGKHRLYADVFLFIAETGLRVSECEGLRNEDVRLGLRPYLIVSKETNTSHSKEGRIVPLTQTALSIIEHYGLPFVFRQNTLRQLLGEARAKFGLADKLCIHAARKSWASRALERNVNVIAVANAGGWSDTKTILRYADRSPAAITAAFA